MPNSKVVPNQVIYQGVLVDGQVILTSVQHPSEYVSEDGKVVMTCESVEEFPLNSSLPEPKTHSQS
jgi:hypothetical protein